MSDPVGAMPDPFDRMLADLNIMKGSNKTMPAIVRTIRQLGVGGSDLYVIQTFRIREEGQEGDVVLLEVTNRDGHFRHVLPQDVTRTILRQHDALTTKARFAGARQAAKTRKARGIEPAFLKKRKK